MPPAAVELADRAAFPIVVIPATSPLDDVLSQTFETIVNRQAAALAGGSRSTTRSSASR